MAKKNNSGDFKTIQNYSTGNLEQDRLFDESAKRLKNDEQIAIKKGNLVDPKVIEQLSGGRKIDTEPDILKFYPDLDADTYDKYKGYVSDIALSGRQLSDETLNQLRFENQSAGEQFANAAGRLATNIVPQILSGVASMVDIPGYWDAEHAANNSIVNWANSVKEWSNEAMPIYENPNDANDFTSSAWWFSRGESLVESVAAFAVTGGVAGKALQGIGAGLRLANSGKFIGQGAKFGKAVMSAGRAQNIGKGIQTVAHATMMNQAEAVMEASQVYKNIYDSKIAKGYSYDEARKSASEGAATTMNINRLNILLNLTSAKLFMSPIKQNAQLIKEFTKINGLKKLVGESSQEALEEINNHVASKAGEAKGKGKDYGWNNVLKDATSADGIEAAFLGALGGGVQQGVVGASQYSKYGAGNTLDENKNRISYVESYKANYAKQQKHIEELKANGANISQAVKQSIAFGNNVDRVIDSANAEDNKSVQEEMKNLFEMSVYNALSTGTQSVLEEMIDNTISDPEITPEEKENALESKRLFKELEKVYYNAENYENVEDIYYNTVREARLRDIQKNKSNEKANVDSKAYQEVSDIAKKYSFQQEFPTVLDSEEKSPSTEYPLPYSMSNLNENPGTTEFNKETYNRFLQEVNNLDSVKKSKALEQELNNVNIDLDKQSKDLEFIKSKEGQNEFKAQKEQVVRNKEIKKESEDSYSIPDLLKLKEQTTDNSVKKFIDDKIKTINAKKDSDKLNKAEDNKVNAYLRIVDSVKVEQLQTVLDSLEDDSNFKKLSEERQQKVKDAISAKQSAKENQEVVSLESLGLTNVDSSEVEENEKNDSLNIEEEYETNSEHEANVEEEILEALDDLYYTVNGQPVEKEGVVFDYHKAPEGHNRAAYLSRLFKQIYDFATGKVNREEITNDVQYTNLLKPEVFKAGTKVTFNVNEKYEGSQYVEGSISKEEEEWNDLLLRIKEKAIAENKDYRKSQEFIDNVPITISDKDGNLVYLHRVNWISPQNINSSKEAIAEDQEKLRKIRKKILENTGEPLTTTITKKSSGVLLKTKDGEGLNVNEAFPTGSATLAIVKNEDFIVREGDKLNPITKKEGKPGPRQGALVAIVPIGDKHTAITLKKQPLTEETKETIYQAVVLWTKGLENPNDSELEILKKIYKATGINIVSENPSDTTGLRQFVSQFIYLYPTESKTGGGLQGLFTNTSDRFGSNDAVITITGNGIEFGRPGLTKKDSNPKPHVIYANKPNSQDTTLGLFRAALNQEINSHVNKDSFTDKKAQIFYLSRKDGNLELSAPIPYSEWLNTAFSSNVFMINVGTTEKPIWTSTIQPTIEYDTVPLLNEETTSKESLQIENKKADIERRRQEELSPIQDLTEGKKGALNTSPTSRESANIGEGFTTIVDKVEFTDEEWKEVRRKWAEFDAKMITPKEFNEWRKEFEQRLGKRLQDTINAKYDAELAALENKPISDINSLQQEVDRLRVEEQENLVKAIPNIADYSDTYGEKQGNMPNNLYAIYKPIYDKYNKDISPLLKQIEDKKSAEKTTNKFNEVPVYSATIEEGKAKEQQLFDILDKVPVGTKIKTEDGFKVVIENSTSKSGQRTIAIQDFTVNEDGSLLQGGIEFITINKEGKLRVDYNPHSVYTNSKGERGVDTDILTNETVDLAAYDIYKYDESTGKEVKIQEKKTLTEETQKADTEETITVSPTELELAQSAADLMTVEELNEEIAKLEEVGESVDESENKRPLGVKKGDKIQYVLTVYNKREEPFRSNNIKEGEIEAVSEKNNSFKIKGDDSWYKFKEKVFTILKNYTEIKELSFLSAQQPDAVSILAKQKEIRVLKKALELKQTPKEGKVKKEKKNPFSKQAHKKNTEFNDNEDFMLSYSQTKKDVETEISQLALLNVPFPIQRDLVNYITSLVIYETNEFKKKGGTGKFGTKALFKEVLENLKEQRENYEDDGDLKSAETLTQIINQFKITTGKASVEGLVKAHINLLTSNKVSNADETLETQASIERVVFSDEFYLTLDSKTTASANLKKFFSSIQNFEKDGSLMINSIGIPVMVPMDIVYNTLHEMLANKKPDYKRYLEILNEKKVFFPWVQSVIDQLETASEEIKNEFVTDMTKHSVRMETIMWEKKFNSDGSHYYALTIYNNNSTSIEERTRLLWKYNAQNSVSGSSLIMLDSDEEYVFNKTKIKEMVDLAKSWTTKSPTIDELADWLAELGIILNDDTYKALQKGEFRNGKRLTYDQLFNNSKGLVNVIAKTLSKVGDSGKTTLEQSEILSDSVVKALAKIEAVYTTSINSPSFSVGGKTIATYTNNKWLVNRMRDLLEDSNLTKELTELSFNQDSLWLERLNNPDTREETLNQMELTYLSLEALKKKYSTPKDQSKLNEITEIDHEFVKLGLFFNNTPAEVGGKKVRKVGYFYPTTSDKSGTHIIHNFAEIVNMEEKEKEDGTKYTTYSDENVDLYYRTVVLPEIKRIFNSEKKKNTTINYEPGYFYFSPELNELKIFEDKTLKELIQSGRPFEKEVTDAVKKYLQEEFLPKQVENKMNDWRTIGVLTNNDKTLNFVDPAYLSRKGAGFTAVDRNYNAAADFVFNYAIANAEMYKTFIGDPAQYSKIKKDRSIKQNMIETYTNIGKRLAADVAPGIELSGANGNTYIQVFFNDKSLGSNNLSDSVQKEFFTRVNKEYGSDKNYGKIDGSDAQEYTTLNEHLYVLEKLGRISPEQSAEVKRTIKAKQKLSPKQLGFVLQPLKPLYAGNIIDKKQDLDRRIYIKSSSFPLIPQLTQGLDIDKVRIALENYENKINKEGLRTSNGERMTVRASFNTANKIGGVTKENSVNVFDDNGNVNDFVIEEKNTLTLKRENFRIQQDVPYDEDKTKVNAGSQEQKLLFSNILDVEGFDYNGKPIKGSDLQKIYLDTYHDLFKYNYENLRDKLGLNQTMESVEEINYNTIENSIFEKLENPKSKREERALKLEDSENYDRAIIINANFDTIIEELIKNKINIFTDKKCD
jgi:hypothetical protein